ncbi:MAG: choice-of-anchor tandem repeat GloVer-containing protein [Terriglobales bacterium]
MATSLVVAAMALILAQLASAQTENVLFNFNNSSTGKDGQTPYLYGSLIMDSEGNLYGAADNGGKSHGVVFKLTPKAKGKDPWKITILHSFKGYDSKKPSKSDGDLPESAVIMDGQGNVYGTTYEGGTADMGTVYELSPTLKGAWTETILHSFTGGDDGVGPSQPLTMDAEGNIYGTTGSGGNGEYCQGIGCGIVFELSPTKSGPWTETIIHAFQGSENQMGCDGSGPVGQLYLNAQGNMYGATYEGGCPDDGTVFELTSNGDGAWNYGQVFVYPGAGLAAAPLGGVIGDAEGNLYGLWDGGVYELQGSGDSFTYETLYFFCSNCDGPIGTQGGGLIFDSSDNLYGTSYGGGNGYGTVFELSPAGGGTWNEETLWMFNHTDGSNPVCSLLLDGKGNLYGSTPYGGASDFGAGVIFQITPQ